MAATVSVALRTALINKSSVKVNALKKKLFKKMRKLVKQRNPIIVPIIPKNATIAKF